MSNTLPPRDLAGRFGGHGAFQVKTPALTTIFTTLAHAESDLKTALTSAIQNLAQIGEVPQGAPIPAIVIAASPGAGKSRVARELLGDLRGNDPIVFHAPTLALSQEAAQHAHVHVEVATFRIYLFRILREKKIKEFIVSVQVEKCFTISKKPKSNPIFYSIFCLGPLCRGGSKIV